MLFTKAIVPLFLAATLRSVASDRYVTLTASGKTNTLEILEGEVAELVSYPWNFAPNTTMWQKLLVFRGKRFLKEYVPRDHNSTLVDDPLVIAGPAELALQSVDLASQSFATFCTFRIFPQPYPPTGTVVIPPGEGGGNIGLECSSDLIAWGAATNGIYANEPTAKFFRLTLERIFPGQFAASTTLAIARNSAVPQSEGFSPHPAGRFVTLMPEKGEGERRFEVPPRQVAKLVSILQRDGGYSFLKDGLLFSTSVYTPDTKTDPVIVAGPAQWIATYPQAVTLEFQPNASDPQTTVVVPPGAAGGKIQLQLSTNLVDWSAAGPGVYTNLTAANFFRISLERLAR